MRVGRRSEGCSESRATSSLHLAGSRPTEKWPFALGLSCSYFLFKLSRPRPKSTTTACRSTKSRPSSNERL
eukprot:1319827-Alexandrium_andersonii.AAC.1